MKQVFVMVTGLDMPCNLHVFEAGGIEIGGGRQISHPTEWLRQRYSTRSIINHQTATETGGHLGPSHHFIPVFPTSTAVHYTI